MHVGRLKLETKAGKIMDGWSNHLLKTEEEGRHRAASSTRQLAHFAIVGKHTLRISFLPWWELYRQVSTGRTLYTITSSSRGGGVSFRAEATFHKLLSAGFTTRLPYAKRRSGFHTAFNPTLLWCRPLMAEKHSTRFPPFLGNF